MLGSKQRPMDKLHVSIREYYTYRLQMRPSDPSLILHVGRLLQQYVTDQYIKIETQRLDFYRSEQAQQQTRQETMQGVLDAFGQSEDDSLRMIGQPKVLPPTFIGGPRDMQQRYMDAMALVQQYGKPDFFITMICNPQWVEIQSLLLPFELSTDRPDLVARVFRMKLEELKYDILKEDLLGKVQAYSYVVEFQKRGLPHVHLLLIMFPQYKLSNPSRYDKFISAELPNKEDNPCSSSFVSICYMALVVPLIQITYVCLMENVKIITHENLLKKQLIRLTDFLNIATETMEMLFSCVAGL